MKVRIFGSAFLTLCISAFLLSACGFEPLYGQKAIPEPLKAGVAVEVSNARPRDGQLFRMGLEDKLNPPGGVAQPAYRLVADLSISDAAIGVARDNTVSRYNLYLSSSYALYTTSDNKKVASGNLSYVTSYNNLIQAYFSTYISREDAIKRGLSELVELYRQRLAANLSQAPQPETATVPDEPVRHPQRDPVPLPVFK